MKLAKAMATVAGLTGLSRVAGFIRDVMTAAVLGAGPIGDAFFIALKLPNFFRRVTAEGAFSVAFVPLYSEALEKDGADEANQFASNTFMVMLSILSVFTCLGLIAMPYVIHVIAPGFGDDPQRFDLAVELSRVTFPYLLLMSLTALLGGVLNAVNRFAPFAFAPVLFNLCLIGALLLSGFAQSAGHALAWGVFLAGIVQMIWLWVSVRRAGIRIRIQKPKMSPRIKKVFKLMGPGMIGAGVMHINLFADMIIASFLQAGAISYLYYADRLNQLPLGVVGIAVGTALLPMLSKALAKGDAEEGNALFNRALEFCLLLALPAAAALMVIPGPLITVLFERGAFTADDTAVTAFVLSCAAIGLPAYIAGKVFATTFWARQDTVTPVKVSIATTVVNIMLALLLSQYIGVAGIALATGIAGWVQFSAYMVILRKDAQTSFDARFKRAAPRIILSTCIMAAVLYSLSHVVEDFIYNADAIKFLALGGLVLAGLATYAIAVTASGAIKLQDFKKYISRG